MTGHERKKKMPTKTQQKIKPGQRSNAPAKKPAATVPGKKPLEQKELNLPAQRKSTLPSTQVLAKAYERDAGSGFEGADRDSYAIPYLVILQAMSPQCNEDADGYVKGAKPGMIYNTATGELFDGKEGVVVVPSQYQRRYVEWRPREEGGGFAGSYAPESVDLNDLQRDESGRMTLENGNYLSDTRYHYCILIGKNGETSYVVISMASTQIKKSRNWMTRMAALKIDGSNGAKFTPPTFSHAYRLTTVSEQNEKGNWKGWGPVEIDHMLGDGEEGIYQTAKDFRGQIDSGKAKVEEPGSAASQEEF